ncbi:MAG: PLDc N-terminal domain-containing protein [Defluviicoccus sp.]|nr:MAG: PLDc N-terminal domain-containing protein [Defluviicoccus sp.]
MDAGLWQQLQALAPALLATFQLLLAAVVSAHVILHKRDVRAAIGWLGLIWLVPLAGSVLYALFGINRIRRRASGLKAHRSPLRPDARHAAAAPASVPCGGQQLRDAAPPQPLPALARLMDRVAGMPLVHGNHILPLAGGVAAYAAMLHAIETANRTLALSTYIFDADATGRRFVDALAAAAHRGVAVRVLIDGVGGRYSRPLVLTLLRERGVTAVEFLPSLFPLSLHYANLRNHRKILVADGRIGFTGGMNIRQGHCLDEGRDAIDDIQFELHGPVVGHLMDTFADDWAFASGELLSGEDWFPRLPAAGPVTARGIAAGPDEAAERIRWAILGALSEARQRVRIVTPYFLPDATLSTALNLATLRGIALDIVLPARNNLRLMQWASWAKLARFLIHGCRVWLTPPPFDHGKLMTVDGAWSLIGSANWDPRSLRLNFELNVEAYDVSFASKLDDLIDARIARARPVTLDDVERRPLAFKLRDGAAWLLSPYL